MASITLGQLAAAIGGTVVGNPEMRVSRPCPPQEAVRDGDLAVAVNPVHQRDLPDSRARAAVLGDSTNWDSLGLDGAVIVPRGRIALARITETFSRDHCGEHGIHPTALIDPGAEIGNGVSVGPFSVIGKGAEIGRGTCILGAVSIGADSRIGAGSLVYPGVRIGWSVSIGKRAILHSNCCIGADGFSFVLPDQERIQRAKQGGCADGGEGQIRKIHSLGGVRVGDDVEIGANTAIDRGTLSDTVIGDGVKIDNLVHIAHNVRVGPHSMLCGQVGIAGSARIGEGCVLGGQVGVGDHVSVGEYSLIGGKSLIARRVKPRSIISGWASLDRSEFHSVFRAIRRLARGDSGSGAG